MILNVRNYGYIKIEEPIIKDIINAKEMQRLKGIDQYAITYLHKWMKVSRFEHSMGVYYLLKKLGAPIEEQISGLIHDISHTAFSHVCDFVFKKYSKQNYHEAYHKTILQNSEVQAIIEKNNLDFNKIIDDSNFPLLEKDLPDLCADRIDYLLRDARIWGVMSCEELDKILNNLIAFDNQIVFTNTEIAKLAADKYKQTNSALWAAPRLIGAYHILAEAIRKGLDFGILIKQDLFTEDAKVLAKLKSSNDKEISSFLDLLNPNLKVLVVNENQEPDICLTPKLRFIDPKIIINNSLQKLSDVDENFRKNTEEYIKEKKKKICIKIIR